jgi:hypothetical protein
MGFVDSLPHLQTSVKEKIHFSADPPVLDLKGEFYAKFVGKFIDDPFKLG